MSTELNVEVERDAALWNAQADQHNQWPELCAGDFHSWLRSRASFYGALAVAGNIPLFPKGPR